MNPEFGVLTNIPTKDIFPHSDNPRTDVGDVTELAESIKANGVLQNLTVVPCYGNETGEFTGTYTVVIGHRRLAAAKLAGIETVPCIISDMTGVQQIRTMLTENMQRTDLTVYEQAQGFQLMLDLGDSVSDITERTGFSATTVRRRMKLLELDKEKFKKAEKRGATLMDYAKLEAIEDLDARNEVLGTMGTANFEYSLKKAIENQEAKVKMAEWLEVIKTFATEDPEASYNTKRYVKNYSRYFLSATVEIPADADTVKYYYKVSERDISIYTDIDQEAEDAKRAEQEEARRETTRMRNLYAGITKGHYELRAAFVQGLSNATCKKATGAIAGLMIDAAFTNQGCINEDVLKCVLGISADEEFDEDEFVSKDVDIYSAAQTRPEKLMLCIAYSMVDDADNGYWTSRWECGGYSYEHSENPLLDRLYEVLEKLGYATSDDEKAMQDGTHEVFTRGG